MEIMLDLTKDGLSMAFNEREIILLEHLWDVPDTIPVSIVEASSRELTDVVNSNMSSLGRTPDRRSSVINAANRFVGLGIWDYRETTGKGGYRKIYRATMREYTFWKTVRNLVVEKITAATEQ